MITMNDNPFNSEPSDIATRALWVAKEDEVSKNIDLAERKLQSFDPDTAAHHFRKAAESADRLVDLADFPKKQKDYAKKAETYREYASALEQHGMDAVQRSQSSPNQQKSNNRTRHGENFSGAENRGRSAANRNEQDPGSQEQQSLVQDEPSFSLESPDIDLSDVGGMWELKQNLRDEVAEPIQRKDLHQTYGIDPTRGVVLQGPPGTGKTYLTRAFAGELGWNFIELAPAQVVSALVGEGARNIQQVFKTAKDNQPCIIFFDEIDNIAKDRTSMTQRSQSEEAMLTQLLTEMTSLGDSDVIVFSATNQPEEVDEALFNAERFSLVFEVPHPDPQARAEILRVHLRKRQVPVEGVDYEEIAKQTEGFTAADMKNVARNAAQQALEDAKASQQHNIVPIRHKHVAAGVKQRRQSVADRSKGGYLDADEPFSGTDEKSDTSPNSLTNDRVTRSNDNRPNDENTER